jgi:hypothetical protein
MWEDEGHGKKCRRLLAFQSTGKGSTSAKNKQKVFRNIQKPLQFIPLSVEQKVS